MKFNINLSTHNRELFEQLKSQFRQELIRFNKEDYLYYEHNPNQLIQFVLDKDYILHPLFTITLDDEIREYDEENKNNSRISITISFDGLNEPSVACSHAQVLYSYILHAAYEDRRIIDAEGCIKLKTGEINNVKIDITTLSRFGIKFALK